jgi:hypothetical protein
VGEVKGREGGPHMRLEGEGMESRPGGSEVEEVGGERIQGKEVEAAKEARERLATLEVEGGKSKFVTEEGDGGGVDVKCIGEGFVEGSLEFAKFGSFMEEEEVREGVDRHGGVPEAVEEGRRADGLFMMMIEGLY